MDRTKVFGVRSDRCGHWLEMRHKGKDSSCMSNLVRDRLVQFIGIENMEESWPEEWEILSLVLDAVSLKCL